MSLPSLRPLLLTVGATSLVFFGGVIALAVQSPNADSVLSVVNPLTQPQSTQPSSLATLTAAQATTLAKQDTPNAILQATPELINYNGTVAYEVRLDNGTTYIDANLGAVLNPVAANDYYVEGYDDEDEDEDDDYKSDGYKDKDDDDKHKDEKHSKRKHDDDDYKDNERLIATSYQQHDEDDFDEESYDD